MGTKRLAALPPTRSLPSPGVLGVSRQPFSAGEPGPRRDHRAGPDAARSLELTIPQSLSLRADQVIEWPLVSDAQAMPTNQVLGEVWAKQRGQPQYVPSL
jgi:hypothetical protein